MPEDSKNVSDALAQLEARKSKMSDIAFMVATVIIRELGDCETREEYEREFESVKEAASNMIPLISPGVPHNYRQLNKNESRRFRTEVEQYKNGLRVGDGIVRGMKSWRGQK